VYVHAACQEAPPDLTRDGEMACAWHRLGAQWHKARARQACEAVPVDREAVPVGLSAFADRSPPLGIARAGALQHHVLTLGVNFRDLVQFIPFAVRFLRPHGPREFDAVVLSEGGAVETCSLSVCQRATASDQVRRRLRRFPALV